MVRTVDGRFTKSFVYGIGIDDLEYPKERRSYSGNSSKIVWLCPAYSHWRNMLQRVYHAKTHAYENVEVHADWHHFSKFKEWFDRNYVKGWHLDKDLYGGKLYSDATCIFIPPHINQSLCGIREAKTGTWFDKTRNNYQSYITINGKRKCIGRFRTFVEAKKIHLDNKIAWLQSILEEYPNLKDAVEFISDDLRNNTFKEIYVSEV